MTTRHVYVCGDQGNCHHCKIYRKSLFGDGTAESSFLTPNTKISEYSDESEEISQNIRYYNPKPLDMETDANENPSRV